MRDTPSSGGPPRSGGHQASSLHPACPKCQRRMTIKQVAPVLFAPNVDDVVYGCEDCGTEIKRSVKRA
jgi:DNA-directed RNA polymerase subunit RPC12/RpoP